MRALVMALMLLAGLCPISVAEEPKPAATSAEISELFKLACEILRAEPSFRGECLMDKFPALAVSIKFFRPDFSALPCGTYEHTFVSQLWLAQIIIENYTLFNGGLTVRDVYEFRLPPPPRQCREA